MTSADRDGGHAERGWERLGGRSDPAEPGPCRRQPGAGVLAVLGPSEPRQWWDAQGRPQRSVVRKAGACSGDAGRIAQATQLVHEADAEGIAAGPHPTAGDAFDLL